MIYTRWHGFRRKGSGLAAWGAQDAAVLGRGAEGGGLVAQAGSARPHAIAPGVAPHAAIGPRCHELRVKDRGGEWRIVYQIDPDAIVIVDVFQKKTRETPQPVIENCRRRLRNYDTE